MSIYQKVMIKKFEKKYSIETFLSLLIIHGMCDRSCSSDSKFVRTTIFFVFCLIRLIWKGELDHWLELLCLFFSFSPTSTIFEWKILKLNFVLFSLLFFFSFSCRRKRSVRKEKRENSNRYMLEMLLFITFIDQQRRFSCPVIINTTTGNHPTIETIDLFVFFSDIWSKVNTSIRLLFFLSLSLRVHYLWHSMAYIRIFDQRRRPCEFHAHIYIVFRLEKKHTHRIWFKHGYKKSIFYWTYCHHQSSKDDSHWRQHQCLKFQIFASFASSSSFFFLYFFFFFFLFYLFFLQHHLSLLWSSSCISLSRERAMFSPRNVRFLLAFPSPFNSHTSTEDSDKLFHLEQNFL